MSGHRSARAKDDHRHAAEGKYRPHHVCQPNVLIEQWFGDEKDQNWLQGTDNRRISNACELYCAEEQRNISTEQDPARERPPQDWPIQAATAHDQQERNQRDTKPKSFEGGDKGGLRGEDDEDAREAPNHRRYGGRAQTLNRPGHRAAVTV